jgi:hypothetical protein
MVGLQFSAAPSLNFDGPLEPRMSCPRIRTAHDKGEMYPVLREGKPRAHVRVIWTVDRPCVLAAFSVRAAFAQLRVRSEGADMATASAGRATRVRRRLPRVPRALAARRSRGLSRGRGEDKPTAR